LVPTPLPHVSSGPENVVLLAASWQLRFVVTGSRMENVPPLRVVAIVTVPLIHELPVPCMTRSTLSRTAPVRASTRTVRRL
jgi:hypothetical protein